MPTIIYIAFGLIYELVWREDNFFFLRHFRRRRRNSRHIPEERKRAWPTNDSRREESRTCTGHSRGYFDIIMSTDIAQDKYASSNGNGQTQVSGVPPPATTRGGLRVYKIVVLGDGGVGKSAVTLQFVSHSFLEYHDPTIEDSYQQQAVIDGEAALLDILDTAGQVEFTAMRDQYMRCGEGFMICYSVTDRHSFQEALEYRKLISRVRANEDIPLVLVGNKFDLQPRRKVTTEEGKALADQLGCPFYETSAALRQFIDDAFYSIVRQIRAKERSRDTVRKHSRWWRLRSIFAFIFRRKQRHNSHYSP